VHHEGGSTSKELELKTPAGSAWVPRSMRAVLKRPNEGLCLRHRPLRLSAGSEKGEVPLRA